MLLANFAHSILSKVFDQVLKRLNLHFNISIVVNVPTSGPATSLKKRRRIYFLFFSRVTYRSVFSPWYELCALPQNILNIVKKSGDFACLLPAKRFAQQRSFFRITMSRRCQYVLKKHVLLASLTYATMIHGRTIRPHHDYNCTTIYTYIENKTTRKYP